MSESLMKSRLIKEKLKSYQLEDRSREILILPDKYKSYTSKIFKKVSVIIKNTDTFFMYKQC